MRENELGRRVAARLRAQGALVYPMVGGAHVPAGWPDKLVWHARWDGLLELKGRGGELSAAQELVLRELHRRRPGHAFLVRHEESERLTVRSPVDADRVLAECEVDTLLETLEELSRCPSW